LGSRFLQGDGVIYKAWQIEILLFQLQALGLDLRQVEDVVDDVHQVLRGTEALAQMRDLGRVGGAPQGQVGHAHDAVHRRAQFVAHVGEEHALGAVGGFRDVARRGQFGGARTDQVFEVIAVLHQFELGLLASRDVGVRAYHPAGIARAVAAHHHAAIEDPRVASILAAHPVFGDVLRAAARQVCPQLGQYDGQVIRMHATAPLVELVTDFPFLIAQHLFPDAAEMNLAPADVPVPQAFARALDGEFPAELAFAQLFFTLAQFAGRPSASARPDRGCSASTASVRRAAG
jgi:hypothetical protein